VETLKEFRNILLGQKLVVHNDHKNIIYGNLTNDRIAPWRLLLEEFGAEYVHVKGEVNVVANAVSRMDLCKPELPRQIRELQKSPQRRKVTVKAPNTLSRIACLNRNEMTVEMTSEVTLKA
jgi:hypothetical protein